MAMGPRQHFYDIIIKPSSREVWRSHSGPPHMTCMSLSMILNPFLAMMRSFLTRMIEAVAHGQREGSRKPISFAVQVKRAMMFLSAGSLS